MKLTSFIIILIILQVQSTSTVVLGLKPDVHKPSQTLKELEIIPKVQAVQFCPHLCECEHLIDELIVQCINKTLLNVPLDIPATVISLNLNGNNLMELNGQNMAHLVSLRSLLLSENIIASVTSDCLDNLTNLTAIDLSNNRIKFMPSRSLHKLKKLLVLNLSHNKLTTISPGFLFSVTSLLDLNLSHNSLIGVDQNQFNYLQHLKHLDLSFNKLKVLKHDWFQHLVKLLTLDLSRNQFSAINNLMFVNMVKLVKLDLSSNNISSLGTVSFKGLVSLQSIDLKNNYIYRLPYRVFSLMLNLESLDLSNNPIKNLKNAFHDNHQLRLLKLNNLTEIIHIGKGSFDSLNNLEELSISGNIKLESIHANALAPLKNCKYLNLTHNKLKSIPRHFLDGLHKLRSISLFENPWVCDCRMFWLFAWLRSLPVPATNFNNHETTFCAQPLNFSNLTVLDALDAIPCRNATIVKTTKHSQFKVGSSALLECNTTGFPIPKVTWIAPNNSQYCASATFNTSNKSSMKPTFPRIFVLSNGNLFVKKLLRNDAGYYFCTASSVLNNVTKSVHLMLDYNFMIEIKIISILVGVVLSASFLVLTLIVLLFRMIARKLGWHCCCNTGSVSPKSKQIKKMLEYIEQYKEHQLEKLRENYTQQTHKIRDNCSQQMERLRESYSLQFERIQNIRDYGTLQIDKVRDNYNQQVQRVRDYSAGQLDKLRDNYLYQRNRIRKFSAHHLYKLRENYKLQQQHLNKIIENLNLDSCRTVCARTESIIFEPQLIIETDFRDEISFLPNPLDQLTCEKDNAGDNLSQNSAYYTPNDSMSRAESPGPYLDEGNDLKSKDSEEYNIQILSTDETNLVLESMAAGGSSEKMEPEEGNSMADVVSLANDELQESCTAVPNEDSSEVVVRVSVA